MQERIITTYHSCGSIRTTAGLIHISQQAARRVLITFGAYSSPEVTAVAELKDMGLSLEQIAEKLNVTRKTVISNSPYIRGSYATGHRGAIKTDKNKRTLSRPLIFLFTRRSLMAAPFFAPFWRKKPYKKRHPARQNKGIGRP